MRIAPTNIAIKDMAQPAAPLVPAALARITEGAADVDVIWLKEADFE